ncbi:MAG TPA: hypothetical protein VFC57_07670, partial [Aeromicrobium sp.]|nr:hypothetical protein [Aeromicrobium sp.]
IENPFEGLTKGEMFRRVADAVAVDAASTYLSATNSCSHTDARYSGAPVGASCGVCFGCLVRRAAFTASGIPDKTTYLVDDTSGRFDDFIKQKSIVEPMRDFAHRGIRARDVMACYSRGRFEMREPSAAPTPPVCLGAAHTSVRDRRYRGGHNSNST